MTKTASALYQFFSSFGIPAYEENHVPVDEALPYITYEVVDAGWQTSTSLTATVWYAKTDFTEIFAKVDEIKARIGEGLRVPVDGGGCLWINRDNPFSQVIAVESENVTAVYLLMTVQTLCD